MKASKIYITHVPVKGRGDFPIDMLRYDSCVPASAEDASKIAMRGLDNTYDDVRAVTLKRYSVNPNSPTRGRWDSFMWEVTEVTDLDGKFTPFF